MKSMIVFALFVAAAVALPAEYKDAVIEQQSSDNIGTGPYNRSFQTSDGTQQQESATFEDGALVVRGQYSYVDPNNVVITVRYVADKDGFHPDGSHLPSAAAGVSA